MPVIAHAFLLTTLDSARVLGVALVCPKARYCSVLSPRDRRIDRRFVSPRDWIAIEHELEVPHEPGLVAADSPVSRALRAGKSVAVQWLHSTPIESAPEATATALDSRLREIG